MVTQRICRSFIKRVYDRRGCLFLADDYPLARRPKIDDILEDIIDSINNCFELTELRSNHSSGVICERHLALLTSASGSTLELNGIISYYGYGFLCDS